MRRVGHFIFYLVQRYIFFQNLSCPEAAHLSPWEIFVSGLSSEFFETQICPGPITANVCAYAVAGIGALKNGA